MDEDEFRKQFMKKSVFRQASSLDLSYVPEKLYCRDNAVNTLIFNFRRILEEEEQPSINCLILGKGGVEGFDQRRHGHRRIGDQADAGKTHQSQGIADGHAD